ncbi:MAG: hypothetical protein JWP91_978 [Fibrobacteres bacterium]|nr:hypothetical protein [Fibrobacterota bacterium]
MGFRRSGTLFPQKWNFMGVKILCYRLQEAFINVKDINPE